MSAVSQDIKAPIDITIMGQNLQNALIALSQKSNVNIVFNPDIIPKNVEINRTFNRRPIRAILNVLLKDQNLRYEVLKGQIIISSKVPKQKFYRLTGFVEDAVSGERLYLTNIYNNRDQSQGVNSNEHGFYSIKLPAGKHSIVFSYLGYATQVIVIDLYDNTKTNVKMYLSNYIEVIKVHDNDTTDNGLINGEVRFNNEEVTNQVGLGGEPDILNLIKSQSGVQTSADGIGGLVIRGGSDDQNLLLLDGGAIYYPNHLFGVFSTVNSAAMRKTLFSKSNFLNPDGKRLSSVIDVRTKDGNLNTYQGQMRASLSAASGSIEGPILKGSSSFVISGRKSIYTPVRILPNQGNVRKDATTSVDFYDIMAKLKTRINVQNSLTLHMFRAGDLYRYELDHENLANNELKYRGQRLFEWNNTLVGLKWSSQLTNKAFFHASANWSSFHYDAQTGIKLDSNLGENKKGNYLSLQSQIDDYRLNADWDVYLNSNHYLQFGVGFINHLINPRVTSVFEAEEDAISSTFSLIELTRQRISNGSLNIPQIDLYFQDHINISNVLRLNIGIYSTLIFSKQKNYYFALPKFALQYSIAPKVKWLSTIQKTAQFFHKVDIDQSTFPNSIWIPIGRNVKPKTSWLFSSGAEWRISNRKVFEVEGFYNILDNFAYLNSTPLISRNSDFDQNIDITSALTTLKGYAYGLEVSYHLYAELFNVKFNYTWSNTNRSEKETGERIRPVLNRHHITNLSITAKPKPGLFITFTGTYGSPSEAHYNFNSFENLISGFNNEAINNYEAINGEDLNANLRLDININMEIGRRSKPKHFISAGLYNLTNRKNDLYRFVDEAEFSDNNKTISPVTSLGIRPILSYKMSL